MKQVLLAALATLLSLSPLFAQVGDTQSKDPLAEARKYEEANDWNKAIPLLSKAYDDAKGDAEIYRAYFDALLKNGDLKEAEKLVNTQHRYRNSPLLTIDYGRLLAAQGKTKKAEEMWDGALQGLTGEDMLTQQMANAFVAAGRDDYAIKVYERSRNQYGKPYSGALARLYAKTGEMDKAVDAVFETSNAFPTSADDTKATLLELLGTDPKKLQSAQKALIKRINQQPDNVYYSDLLTWLYTQKGDWDGALLQIEAIDERNREAGQRLLDFARNAQSQGQPDVAIRALDAVIQKGTESPYYSMAMAEKLRTGFKKVQDDPGYTRENIAALEKGYAEYLERFPDAYGTQAVIDYATLEARYAGNAKNAIALLRKAIGTNSAPRDFIGHAKLQLGDYQLLNGEIWEAALTYAQVDKAFKEDVLGEDARFRNAKLAYYRGDFVESQGMLSVLKASTSELIANDALYLSVLITENTPDSVYTPLLSFARADLLLFQNKDTAALDTLNALSARYPESPLQDDILMLRSDLSIKHRDYANALGYLKTIIDKYGKDVLADDATFKTAELYEKYLKQPENARKWYEQLIIDYPGSTYVQIARQRLGVLNGTGSAAPL